MVIYGGDLCPAVNVMRLTCSQLVKIWVKSKLLTFNYAHETRRISKCRYIEDVRPLMYLYLEMRIKYVIWSKRRPEIIQVLI